MKIYTIGHSDHSKEEFLEILNHAEIEFFADVQSFPYSKKHPQFNGENMNDWLKGENINYEHIPELGGPTLNDGWNNQSFHNYSDYTLSDEFSDGINALTETTKNYKIAYMCSESHAAIA